MSGGVTSITATTGSGAVESEHAATAADATHAGRGAGLGAGAVAGFAAHEGGNFDFDVGAAYGFFQTQLQRVAQVRAATRPTALAAAKNIAKNIAENIAEIAEARSATAHACAFHRGVAVAVVSRALIGIRENFVGFAGFLEFFFRFLVIGVAIGVKLHRDSSVSLF